MSIEDEDIKQMDKEYVQEDTFKMILKRIKSLENKLMLIEDTLDTLSNSINKIREVESNHYYDLNNKVASIRGMLAVNAKLSKKQIEQDLPLPPLTTLDLDEYNALKGAGLTEKQIREFCKYREISKMLESKNIKDIEENNKT